jgi:hypothetical protein
MADRGSMSAKRIQVEYPQTSGVPQPWYAHQLISYA